MPDINDALFLTGSGFEHLGADLTAIYGERGKPAHNIIRFLESEEFRSACRTPQSLEEIPELSPEELLAIVERQNRFKQLADDLCKKFDALNNEKKLTDEDYLAIAGIMGIVPGTGDLPDTLFPHLVDLYVSSEEEAQEIFEAINKHRGALRAAVDGLFDFIRDGHFIRTPKGETLSQGYARYYFRGENAYYKSSRASAYRGLPGNREDRLRFLLPKAIKLAEFTIWLDTLDCIKNSPGVDKIAIAQHYGIPTDRLDFTSDLTTALFFACCRYDEAGKRWLPLTNADLTDSKHAENVLRCGGDPRFGILYSEPADVTELQRFTADAPARFTHPQPLGYQPFYRMPCQHGYLIKTDMEYDALRDASFAKIKFRHDEDLSRHIFELAEQGNKIYAADDVGSFAAAAERIRASKEYTQAGFDEALKTLSLFTPDADECRAMLNDLGWKEKEHIEWISPNEQKTLDAAWEKDYFLDRFGITPTYRFGFCI